MYRLPSNLTERLIRKNTNTTNSLGTRNVSGTTMHQITLNIPAEYYDQIKSGVTAAVVLQSKVEPQPGQPLLLVRTPINGEDISTVITHVSTFKMHKGCYLLSFPPVQDEVTGMTVDMTKINFYNDVPWDGNNDKMQNS